VIYDHRVPTVVQANGAAMPIVPGASLPEQRDLPSIMPTEADIFIPM
jgi:hypothetical protein